MPVLMLRLFVFLFIGMTAVVSTATAQEDGQIPHFVQFAIDHDDPSQCDDVGWSYLPIEMREDKIEVSRHSACHGRVGGMLLASCVEPFVYLGDEYVGGPPPGVAHIHCRVGVIKAGDPTLDVNPSDFYLAGEDAIPFSTDPTQMQELPIGIALQRTELAFKGDAISGRLVFSVPDTISRPFLVMWWPDRATADDPVVIVVDRTIPWEDAREL